MSSQVRNVYTHAITTSLSSLVQLGLVLGLSYWLDIESFAIFLTAIAVIGIGEIASDFGVRMWAVRKFATVQNLQEIVIPILLTKGAYTLLTGATIMLLPFKLLDLEQALIIAMIATLQPGTDPSLWYLRGINRLDLESFIVLIWRIANTTLMLLLALWGAKITVILSGWLVSNLLRFMATICLPYFSTLRKKNIYFVNTVKYEVQYLMKKVFPIGIAFLLMALYHRMGVLLLGQIDTAQTVAWYGAAFALVSSAGFIATSITVSSFPLLARAVESAGWDSAAEIAQTKFKWIMLVFLPICLLGGLLAPWVITILYPNSYQPSSVAMLALLPGLYMSSINFAMKYLLNALQLDWYDVVSVLIGVGLFTVIVIMSPTEKRLFFTGLAWGVGETAIFIMRWWFIFRDGRIRQLKLARHLFIYLILVGVFTYTL